MKRAIIWGLGTIVVFVLLLCSGMGLPLDIAFALAFGWVMYVMRVVPQVTMNWSGVATAAVCLVLFGLGSHSFLRWLYGQVRSDHRWRARWSFALTATIVLMFVAGLSVAGIAHQVGWLVNAKESLLGNSGLQAARRSQSTNNFKDIGIALHNYHAEYATLPPGGTFDAEGRPLHGWQAMVLPYMETRDLFDRIDFSVPWDHPRNREAYQTRLTAYLIPGIHEHKDAAGYALSHYAGNARVLGGTTSWTFADVKDGLSSTIMAGQVAANFKPWGDPVNWRDPALGINRSPNGFGSPFPKGANMLMMDGSVKFVKDTIDPDVLKAMSTPAGGELVPGG